MAEDYYKILGTSKEADADEIKSAYRELAKMYHPDRHQGNPDFEEKFKRISEAYEVLSDPDKRRHYDDRQSYQSYQNYSSPPSPSYQKARHTTEYSPKVKFYGRLAVGGIVILVAAISFSVYYYASIVRFDEAVSYEQQGNNVMAVHFYEESVRFGGARNFEALSRAGNLFLGEDLYGKANEYFRRAMAYSTSEETALLYFTIANTYYEWEKYDSAVLLLDEASRANYRSDSVLHLSAQINAFGLENFDQAISDYYEMIEMDVLTELAWFGIGFCEHSRNDLEAAINAYSEAISINPEYAMALYYRGNALFFNDQKELACEDFDRARQLNYRIAESTFMRYCNN